MKKLFVSYELALQLKEKGFNEDCFGCYYKDKTFAYHPDSDVYVDAPLYQQVIDWFREKHDLHIIIDSWVVGSRENFDFSFIIDKLGYNRDAITAKRIFLKNSGQHNAFNEYYEALNKAIERALKLI